MLSYVLSITFKNIRYIYNLTTHHFIKIFNRYLFYYFEIPRILYEHNNKYYLHYYYELNKCKYNNEIMINEYIKTHNLKLYLRIYTNKTPYMNEYAVYDVYPTLYMTKLFCSSDDILDYFENIYELHLNVMYKSINIYNIKYVEILNICSYKKIYGIHLLKSLKQIKISVLYERGFRGDYIIHHEFYDYKHKKYTNKYVQLLNQVNKLNKYKNILKCNFIETILN